MRKLAILLNVIFIFTFVYLVIFDGAVGGIFEILLPVLVLITPIINLYALGFLDIKWVVRVIKSKAFKYASSTTLLLLIATTTVLMFEGDDSEIYMKAFRHLIEKDDTYGGQLNPQVIYISKAVMSDPISNKSEGVLPSDVVEVLKQYADRKSLDVRFYDTNNPLEYNELGEIKSGGVSVSFGQIQKYLLFSEIEGSIYIASLSSGGTSYKFIRWFGGWKLYSSEMTWIS